MILNSPRLQIEVILSEEEYTADVDVVVIYHDIKLPTDYIPGVQTTKTTGTAVVVVVDPPATNVQRVIKRITVVNNDTIDHVVKVQLNNTVMGKTYVFALDTLKPNTDLVYTG